MVGRVQVALLGPVEARVDGAAVTLTGVTQRLLLARLALSARRAVPAAELVDLLWPHDPPRNAVGDLQSYVSRLRRVLGADRITRHAGSYRLHVDPDDVDVGRVERLAAEARDAAPGHAVALLGRALDLWRGEALGDLAEHLGFAPEVARLAELRVRLLADRLELRLAVEPVAEVLPDLERAARAHPMRERLQLLLMRALHRDGRAADALAVGDGYRRRLAEDAGLDPGPELVRLRHRILADDAHPGPPRRRHAPRDRFVGRTGELAWLRAATSVPGLVSVVGPGGVGKTRLAQELLDGRREPAHLVELSELSELSDPGDVPVVVAAALGLRAAPANVLDAIADQLADEPALVVLDGCEHVLRAVAPVVTEVLARCREAGFLVTSRVPLGPAGERVLRVGPLAPDEQVDLFHDRASALRPGFAADRSAVAEVCALVDGLPLGVELAARREAAFGVPQLRERLRVGLEILEPVGGGDRSSGLAATVEWSYRLLDPHARVLFDRLAVCRGGFGLDAVDHLAPSGGPAALAALVDASMVTVDLATDPPHYRLPDPMRHVGAAHLTREELDDARDAHARWMQGHLESVHRLQTARSPRAQPLLRRELPNVREALARLVEAGRFAQAGRLAVLVAVAVSDDPHLDLLAQLRRLDVPAATAGADPDGAALCLVAAGGAAWLQGEAPAAERLLSSALDRLPPEHHHRWVARWFRLMNRMYTGDAEGVTADTTDLLDAGQAPGWVRATAVCCSALIMLFRGDRRRADDRVVRHDRLLADAEESDGFIAYTRGELAAEPDPAAALAWFELAVRRCTERGHTYNRQVAAIGRAAVLLRMGRSAEAAAACRTLLDELRSSGMWPQLWTVIRLVAELLVAVDDPRPAAALLAAADRDPLAPTLLGPDRSRRDRLWERLVTGGTTGTVPRGRREAVALALAALDRHIDGRRRASGEQGASATVSP